MRRLALTCVLLALALSGCGGGDEEPAGGSAPLRYAVVGDSNSNGEAAGPDGAADPEAAWPAQLARRLSDDGLAVDLVANPAITGATIEQATSEELPAFKAARPDVATLMLGNNDWVAEKTPDQFRAQFKALLAEVVAATGGDPERVICVGTTAFYVTETGKGYVGSRDAEAGVKAYNAIVREESEAAGAGFVDVVELSEAMADDPALVAPDALHASKAMLGRWAERIAEVARERWDGLAPR